MALLMICSVMLNRPKLSLCALFSVHVERQKSPYIPLGHSKSTNNVGILFINKHLLYLLTEQTEALRVLHKLIVPKDRFTAILCKFEQIYTNKSVRQL